MNILLPGSRPAVVVILGMHRSGTSMVAGLLKESGFFLGADADVIRPDRWNEKGYFEQWRVYRLNEHLLETAGGSWVNPPPARDIEGLDAASDIRRVLAHYVGKGAFLIKDPRFCLTFPLWEPYLPGPVRIVRVLRAGSAVAASLHRRDGLPLWRGRELWRTYNRRALRYAARSSGLAVHYEDFFGPKRVETLKALAGFLGIEGPLEDIAEATIDPRLKHHAGGEMAPTEDFESPHRAALMALEAGDHERARRLLEALVAREPDHAPAHNDLGVLCYRKGDSAGAALHLRRAASLEPRNRTFAANLARVLSAPGPLPRKGMSSAHGVEKGRPSARKPPVP